MGCSFAGVHYSRIGPVEMVRSVTIYAGNPFWERQVADSSTVLGWLTDRRISFRSPYCGFEFRAKEEHRRVAALGLGPHSHRRRRRPECESSRSWAGERFCAL